MVFVIRGFLRRFDNSVFEEICKDQGTQRSPTEIHAELVRRRISHVYVDWREINRYRQPGNYGFPLFIKQRLFDDLVHAGVLEPPLQSLYNLAEVYRVKNPVPIESPDGS